MDVYAFRIIVDKVDTCYRVLGAVHNLYKQMCIRDKVSSPLSASRRRATT